MPNIKSAIKRVDVIEKKTLKNNMIKSEYKTAVKKFEAAVAEGNKENAQELDEAPLSLGIERVMGLYSQGYKRRWYDKNLPINRIFKSA